MSLNVAARAGRWSASHWKTATFGWIVFVVAAVVLGGVVGTKQLTDTEALPGESGRAAKILDEGFPQPAAESVLVQSGTLRVESAAFLSAVEDVVARISGTGVAQAIENPLAPGNADQVSPDGRSAVVNFDIRGDPDTASDRIDPVIDAVAAAKAAHPDVYIGGFGWATADKQIGESVNKDLERAGLLSLPVTIVVLLVAFGALVAAGIPVLLAVTGVIATMGLLAIPSHVWPVDENVSAVVLLIGLAVGVDYSLFYLKREREERAAGRSERAALEAAAATSGRAVLISGLTVMIAMAGMFLTGDKSFGSFAMATIMVVAIAVLGSLTVLPALLSRLGDRVNSVRVPLLHRLQRPQGGGRVWGWTLDRVLRRPLLAALVSAGLLVALAVPALGMNTVLPGVEALPQNLSAVQTYKRLERAFPGEQAPAIVVVKARSIDDPKVEAAIGELRRKAVASGDAHEPITVAVNEARTVARIEIPIVGNGSDDTSSGAISTLRDDVLPATVGRLDGVEAGVTGDAASSKDFDAAIRGKAPLVFGFVLAFAFLLLLVSFRSVVIAIKAVVLNLLSVAAAYGVLVLVFQYGWGSGLLGVDYTGASSRTGRSVGLAITPLVLVLLAGRWARPDIYRALLYQVCGLAIASLAFAVLIAGWTVTLVFAITPLVFPLLFGLRWVVGQLARLQALTANGLLGTRLSPPVFTTRGASFWSRSLNVLRDGAFWKQQAHLLLTWPIALIPLAFTSWALELISIPVWYRWAESNDVLGFIDVDTLGESLPFAVAGLVLLVVVAYGIGPYTRLSRWLAVRLLAGEPGRRRPRRSPVETRRRRLIGLTVTSLVATSVVLACIAIWELTTPDRYFWPVWPLLSLSLVVAISGWIVLVLERDDISRRTLGSRALAIQLGVTALLEAFLIGVWAVTGGGYFWPIWPALGLALLAIAHAAVVFGRREHRIRELETTRAGAIDVQEAELRRIERDLHDGAQARLVALGMSLGMAEEKLKTDPEGALLLLAEARSGARAALEELRDLARGIHPPILTDRGLEAAITALAVHSPVPVSVTVGVASRPAATVETATYFVVAEALANAIKYGGGERIEVRIWRSNGTLVAEVEDDGAGGADPEGSGLTGLRQRVAALDGTFTVESPAGGPTKVRAELPCGS